MVKPKMEYNVVIFSYDGRRIEEARQFPVGEWKEIGYWLDNNGYIDPQYEIRVTIEIPL